MIVVGIKPDRFVKQSGNEGKPYMEHLAVSFGYDFLAVESIDEIPKDKPIVLFSDHGEHDIRSFSHPEDAYYVFGPDWEDTNIEGYTSVKIPNTEKPRYKELFADQAASIAIWEHYKANLK